jgi:TrmH family RNA methyltransferase
MPKALTLTSAANPLLKDVRKAIARGGLTSQGCCVAETFHLLEEALRSGCEIENVLASESACGTAETLLRGLAQSRMSILPDRLFESLSTTETSQGVMALVRPPSWKIDDLLQGTPLVLILDELQDPGNAGTIIRAAEAFGATGAVFVKGSVSPYNPKTLRASAGSLFRLPFIHSADAGFVREVLQKHGVNLFAAVPAGPNDAAASISDVDFKQPCGVVIGNEARGISGTFRSAARAVSIPTTGVESLNAALAAGIILYEASRQRAGKT